MNKALKLSGALIVALGLTACQSRTASTQNHDAQSHDSQGNKQGGLVGARIGGPFTLIDQDGKTVHWKDFQGKYRLVYFGYTYCPDVCPLDLSKIMAGYHLLEKSDPAKAAKIQPIFITVDPQRDTPAVLKQYVAAFDPNMIGLTGTVAQIDQVKHEFAVFGNKEGDPKATKDYLVSHSRTPYLFGPDGKPIEVVPVSNTPPPEGPGVPSASDAMPQKADDASPKAIRAFLEKWVT